MKGLNQAIAAGTASLKRRMSTMVRLARLTRVDAEKDTQALQVEAFAGELHDNVKHVEAYGFTSHPLTNAEAVVVFPGGVLSNPVALVVGGRAYRLQGLKAGEVAIYDDQGQKLVFERDRVFLFTDRPDGVVVDTTKMEVTAREPDGIAIDTTKMEVTAHEPDGVSVDTTKLTVVAHEPDGVDVTTTKLTITLTGGGGVTVNADHVVVNSDDIALGSEGGPQVARVGDMVNVQWGSSAGLHPIVTGSPKVTAT